MLARVRHDGRYPTLEFAEIVVRRVLVGLGEQLTGTVCDDLARCLPVDAARILTCRSSGPGCGTGQDFVRDLAARTQSTRDSARWDCGSVLGVVAALAGPDLLSRVLGQLPRGYALLFGKAELPRPPAQGPSPPRTYRAQGD
jgi:hypothetical protein